MNSRSCILASMAISLSCTTARERDVSKVGNDATDLTPVQPATQTIPEGGLAAWSGTVLLVKSTAGDPVAIRWDYDGDGTPDDAVCDDDVTTAAPPCTSACALEFVGDAIPPVDILSSRYAFALGDFDTRDQSANLDAALGQYPSTIQVYTGDGTSAFTADPAASGGYFGLVSAFVDTDGNLDLLSATGNGNVTLELGAGDGTFGASAVVAQGLFIAALDLNSDGRTDLAVENPNAIGGMLVTLLGNGDGTFGAPVPVASGLGSLAKLVATDVNGDLLPDLVAIGYSASVVFLNDGSGGFAARALAPTPTSFQDAVLGDFNGDGIADIVAVSFTSESTFLGIGNGDFDRVDATNIAIGYNYALAAAGDLDKDGRDDVAIVTGNRRLLTAWRSNGDGTFEEAAVRNLVYFTSAIAIADVNRDARLDILVLSERPALSGFLSKPPEWNCPVSGAHSYSDSKGTGAGPSFTWHPILSVSTTSSGTASLTRDVLVENRAPAVDSSSPSGLIAEGATFLVQFGECDAPNDAVSLDVDWGDGDVQTFAPGSSCGTVTATHTFANGGAYSVSAIGRDDEGGVSDAVLVPVTVADVAPYITAVLSNGPVAAGQPITLTTILEHNIGDLLRFDVDWNGNGTFNDPVDLVAGTSNTASLVSGTAQSIVVHVRVSDDDGNSTIGSALATWFAVPVNHVPAKPGIVAPAPGATVTENAPWLSVASAQDVDADVLRYEFELDLSPTFDSPALQASGAIASTAGTISWQSAALPDDTHWFWRARAADSQAAGDWALSSFAVDSVNSPPSVPIVLGPMGGSIVDAQTIALSVFDSTDPDGTTRSYRFVVSADAAGTDVLESSPAVPETAFQTSWTPATLRPGKRYFWRTTATDEHGLSSAASAPATFRTAGGGGGGGCSVAESGNAFPAALLAMAALMVRRRRRG